MKTLILAVAFAASMVGAASAATIDLASKGLQLSASPVASSSAMSITDLAPLDFGFGPIPNTAFFQASDFTSVPALELNTGDGISFNLSVTPGFTGVSSETAREGDRQLELLFDLAGSSDQAFARFILADGDSLDDIFTGSVFAPAAITVWNVESVSTTPVPLPAGLPLMLAGMGAFAVVARRRKRA